MCWPQYPVFIPNQTAFTPHLKIGLEATNSGLSRGQTGEDFKESCNGKLMLGIYYLVGNYFGGNLGVGGMSRESLD
jgi:hypothetical protein